MESGFLLVDKPSGMTSHDVIDALRRVTGIRKIGHAGTLDPFATGLLLVAIGREATREIQQFVGLNKSYEATFVLGATTETLDPESDVVRAWSPAEYSADQIRTAMQSLTGDISQIPPMYAAIKKDGKKLYELARKGETVEREPRHVRINRFELVEEPVVQDGLTTCDVLITCSSGTYVRALARDLAQELGTTGFVQTLRRTTIGALHIDHASPLQEVTKNNWTDSLQNMDEIQVQLDEQSPV